MKRAPHLKEFISQMNTEISLQNEVMNLLTYGQIGAHNQHLTLSFHPTGLVAWS